jgi:hypothetical protein
MQSPRAWHRQHTKNVGSWSHLTDEETQVQRHMATLCKWGFELASWTPLHCLLQDSIGPSSARLLGAPWTSMSLPGCSRHRSRRPQYTVGFAMSQHWVQAGYLQLSFEVGRTQVQVLAQLLKSRWTQVKIFTSLYLNIFFYETGVRSQVWWGIPVSLAT